MTHCVGLDASVKSVSICVVDAAGEVLARGDTATDPAGIAQFIDDHAPGAERVVHKSGIRAIWLTRELEKRGVPIVCIDARPAHKALSGRINKTDPGDAEGLAHLARTGWFTPVHIRSEASERVRVLTGTRERLTRMPADPIEVRQNWLRAYEFTTDRGALALNDHARGVSKTFGICMKPVARSRLRESLREQLGQVGHDDPGIELMAEMFNPIHEALCAAGDAMDEQLKSIARESDLARRLMTVPGVGPIVALSFIATVDDASRFKKSRDVGAYLGLTPRRHQSDEVDWSGRISRCGDSDPRRLLYSAATTLITQVRKPSPLLSRAKQLYDKKGFKKAAVAAARKIAVTLHSVWRDGTLFDPGRKTIA